LSGTVDSQCKSLLYLTSDVWVKLVQYAKEFLKQETIPVYARNTRVIHIQFQNTARWNDEISEDYWKMRGCQMVEALWTKDFDEKV